MSDAPSAAGSSRASAQLLASSERILQRWEERLRQEVPAAEQERHLILVNTLPALLQQLAEALQPQHPRRTATDGSSLATEHGSERVRLTRFQLQDLLTEYRLLREVLFEVLEAQAPLTVRERATLHTSIDQAIQEACTAYLLVQEGLREQFLATLAHDLRGPLSAAKANASLILRKPGGEQVPRWAARVVDGLDRVDRMLRDLLDAARLQAATRQPLELEACDLVEIARQALEQLEAEHGERFVLVAPEPVPGHFAPEPLLRAVLNLASNAVKYGAPHRPITLTVRQAHGRALLQVHNHGPHIPAEQQETLFRAFQRLREAERSGKPGWGLGLAQVRSVAEAHGGSIGVDSLPEHGTTFSIDIPRDARPFQGSPTLAG